MQKILPYLLIALLFAACKNNVKTPVVQVNIDSVMYKTIADTLICDVIIKNPDTTDTWTQQCLQHFNKQAFIDTLFADIYSGKLQAFDFYSNTPLSIAQIKVLEHQVGYNRNIVGKMQFNETWGYNRHMHTMIKKVNSVIFGFETFSSDGEFRGYKPLFKVFFN